MTDKELKKLSRSQLLEMLIAQSEENEKLKKSVSELQERLQNREIQITEAGSMADAAIKINRVFEAAQAACDQYLESVRNSDTITVTMRYEPEAEKMLAQAAQDAERIRSEAMAEAKLVLTQAEEKEAEAEKRIRQKENPTEKKKRPFHFLVH